MSAAHPVASSLGAARPPVAAPRRRVSGGAGRMPARSTVGGRPWQRFQFPSPPPPSFPPSPSSATSASAHSRQPQRRLPAADFGLALALGLSGRPPLPAQLPLCGRRWRHNGSGSAGGRVARLAVRAGGRGGRFPPTPLLDLPDLPCSNSSSTTSTSSSSDHSGRSSGAAVANQGERREAAAQEQASGVVSTQASSGGGQPLRLPAVAIGQGGKDERLEMCDAAAAAAAGAAASPAAVGEAEAAVEWLGRARARLALAGHDAVAVLAAQYPLPLPLTATTDADRAAAAPHYTSVVLPPSHADHHQHHHGNQWPGRLLVVGLSQAVQLRAAFELEVQLMQPAHMPMLMHAASPPRSWPSTSSPSPLFAMHLPISPPHHLSGKVADNCHGALQQQQQQQQQHQRWGEQRECREKSWVSRLHSLHWQYMMGLRFVVEPLVVADSPSSLLQQLQLLQLSREARTAAAVQCQGEGRCGVADFPWSAGDAAAPALTYEKTAHAPSRWTSLELRSAVARTLGLSCRTGAHVGHAVPLTTPTTTPTTARTPSMTAHTIVPSSTPPSSLHTSLSCSSSSSSSYSAQRQRTPSNHNHSHASAVQEDEQAGEDPNTSTDTDTDTDTDNDSDTTTAAAVQQHVPHAIAPHAIAVRRLSPPFRLALIETAQGYLFGPVVFAPSAPQPTYKDAPNHWSAGLPEELAASVVNMAVTTFANVHDGDVSHVRLLDPCCGQGSILFQACRRGMHATGMDISLATLDAADENLQTLGVRVQRNWGPHCSVFGPHNPRHAASPPATLLVQPTAAGPRSEVDAERKGSDEVRAAPAGPPSASDWSAPSMEHLSASVSRRTNVNVGEKPECGERSQCPSLQPMEGAPEERGGRATRGHLRGSSNGWEAVAKLGEAALVLGDAKTSVHFGDFFAPTTRVTKASLGAGANHGKPAVVVVSNLPFGRFLRHQDADIEGILGNVAASVPLAKTYVFVCGAPISGLLNCMGYHVVAEVPVGRTDKRYVAVATK